MTDGTESERDRMESIPEDDQWKSIPEDDQRKSIMEDESEFTFELRVCQWAELNWPPDSADTPSERSSNEPSDSLLSSETPEAADSFLVARQLGTKRRRWDTIVIETDSQALDARARFGTALLDSDQLHIVRNAPVEWAYYREALPDPGYPWRYVREAIHEVTDRGIIEQRRQGNRIEIRRKWEYPDWVHRIVAIENKPELDTRLTDQVAYDCALGLADEVWVATRSTHATVEPVLLEQLPLEAGVLAIDRMGEGSVLWHPQPRTIDPERVGSRILDEDAETVQFEYADSDWKERKRLEIAERAYERGWRSYADSMRTDCRWFGLCRAASGARLPWCTAKEETQTARDCSESCPSFEPEPPAWRTRGWPIEGGPGRGITRLLDRQRERNR